MYHPDRISHSSNTYLPFELGLLFPVPARCKRDDNHESKGRSLIDPSGLVYLLAVIEFRFDAI